MSYNLSDMIITRVYSATTMYTEASVHMKRENRSSWAVVIKYEGETVYTSNGIRYLSNLHNIVILPKGCNYEWDCTKAGHFSIIEFETDFECDTILTFKTKNSDSILKAFKGLEYKRLIKKNMYQMESIRDTYSIILRLTEQSQSEYVPSRKAQKLDKVLEYISINYTQDIKNDELAKIIGVSTVYFRKLFTEVYGTSPMNYIKELRMKKAKEMLRSDYGSITDIAMTLGYSTIYDFSRDFKKHVGVSPSKYN